MPIDPVRRGLLVALAFTLAGCGDGYGGSTYASADGTKVEFKSGGKAFVTILGMTTEGTYSVDGDKVTLKPKGDEGSNVVLTKKSEGTLDGGLFFGQLKKQ